MATFTLLAWIAALAIMIWLVRRLVGDTSSDDGALRFSIILTLWTFTVFGLASALISDIYKVSLGGDSLPSQLTWWVPVVMDGESISAEITRETVLLIAGLAALGSASVLALGYNLVKGREQAYYTNSYIGFGSVGSFILQLTGLVSSILGILSFYLEYLR